MATVFAHKYPDMCAALILGNCCNEMYGGSVKMSFGAMSAGNHNQQLLLLLLLLLLFWSL